MKKLMFILLIVTIPTLTFAETFQFKGHDVKQTNVPVGVPGHYAQYVDNDFPDNTEGWRLDDRTWIFNKDFTFSTTNKYEHFATGEWGFLQKKDGSGLYINKGKVRNPIAENAYVIVVWIKTGPQQGRTKMGFLVQPSQGSMIDFDQKYQKLIKQ